jgi:cobalamin-dependent methionine synthase I
MNAPKPLLCRLADLIRELHESAALFKSQNNDEAYCSTSACAERLAEVVNEYISERDAYVAAQMKEAVPQLSPNPNQK